MQHDTAGSLKLHRLFEVRRSLKVTEPCPYPPPSSRRPGSRSRTCAPRSTADGIPSRRSRAIRSTSRRRSSRTATTSSARSFATGRPARASGSRRRSSRSATTAGRAASSRPGSAAGSSRSRRGSTATRPCSTSSTASSPPARPSSPASSPRRRRSSAPASSDAWRTAAAKQGAKDRHGKTSLAKPLEVDVERIRARFGAWYELFPRSWGGFKGVAEGAAATGRARLRRRLPAADPPDRRDEPQGPQQRADGGEGRSRQPLGDRRQGGRPRRDPSRARDAEGLRRPRRRGAARPGSRSRSTSRSRPRPTTPG